MRIGIGYDAHRLEKDRRLILGGVEIEHEKGLLGHSDADVLVHAIMDALLGAAAMGDIGKHFPDTDIKYKDINSMSLLRQVYQMLATQGYKIVNIDSVIIAQKPKLAPHIEKMRENIANSLYMDISDISIKATTEENMGFTGREEGISAKAVCLIEKIK
ncbi:MAG: 2-C-methyl-D-erythritol 2,4-cyclodiphosphate synthase [Eubacteriaceae bacterium]|nr:2-C-methyl-D-erythritol 2,4-cyclodiphosphate synthase [Eubacteriaceae bacterium]